MIHTVKGFGIANKAEIDVFLELSCFFHDPADAGNLISVSSVFSKSSLNVWKFTVHILLKPGLENFEHYFTSMWIQWNCAAVWAFFGIAFLWGWNENWPFPVLWPLLGVPNLLALDWNKHKLESRFLGEISIISDMQLTHPYGRKWRGTKKPLDESERGEWKVGLKFSIHKTKIMASIPITS